MLILFIIRMNRCCKVKISKNFKFYQEMNQSEIFLPETKIPNCYSFKYSIIDTPGYDDLNGNDKTIFRHIDNFLTSKDYKIKGIVL